VLVTNEGVSSGLLTLSCRADRPAPKPLPEVDPQPIPDSATGARGSVETMPEPPGPRPAGMPEPAAEPAAPAEPAVPATPPGAAGAQ
jgi:serine/threonine-protein kinase